jgi:hypothetical protein
VNFVEGCEEEDFVLATIADEDFGDVPFVDVDGDDHSIGMGKRSTLTSWLEKLIGMWDHLVLVRGL